MQVRPCVRGPAPIKCVDRVRSGPSVCELLCSSQSRDADFAGSALFGARLIFVAVRFVKTRALVGFSLALLPLLRPACLVRCAGIHLDFGLDLYPSPLPARQPRPREDRGRSRRCTAAGRSFSFLTAPSCDREDDRFDTSDRCGGLVWRAAGEANMV